MFQSSDTEEDEPQARRPTISMNSDDSEDDGLARRREEQQNMNRDDSHDPESEGDIEIM